jgi:hypothetical protein
MCKVLLAVFLALSLAVSANASIENGLTPAASFVPSKQLPVYNTAFDDDQRGLKPLFVAIQDFPFYRETASHHFALAEIRRQFGPANSPAKLSTVLLI